MSYRGLYAKEMCEISEPWVTEGAPARAAIESDPMLAPLLPKLKESHEGVVAVCAQKDEPDVQELASEESRLDARHDEQVRVMHDSLTVLSAVSKSPDELLHLRNLLFPEGKLHTMKSRLEEAGHATAVAQGLTPELEARMQAVIIGDSNLLEMVKAWLDVSKQLGDVVERRARLTRPARTQAAQISAARRTWIRWTKALVASAENAEISEETDTLLFSALRDAEHSTRNRWSRHAQPVSGPAPIPGPEPVSGPVPVPGPEPGAK